MARTRSGLVLDGRYRLSGVLGRGAYGTVYRADDLKEPGRQWAIKELSLQFGSPQEAAQTRDMLDREHKVLSWLNHPGIVMRREVLIENNHLYLVMEFVNGDNLETLINRTGRSLPAGLAVALAEQVCAVLAYLHGQKPYPIIFRDLKPSNLMLSDDGSVKIIDFGIARLYNPTDNDASSAAPPGRTRRGKKADTYAMGTPGYAAPEQYPGSGMQTDGRADIYALGVMMHHLITRSNPADLPVPLPSISTLGCSVERGVEAVVERATHPDRDKRYSSAQLLARELATLRETQFKLSADEARRRLAAWRRGSGGDDMTLDDAMHEMERYLKERKTPARQNESWLKRTLRRLKPKGKT
jgi:serine/threonine-protein kinase